MSDLTFHRIIAGIMLCILVAYNIICHIFGSEIQMGLQEDQREVFRTVMYAIAIVLFPLVNVLRHILLKLNQTMPGRDSAKSRYLITTIVTLACIEVVGLFGLLMFLFGDDFNTLYIFTALGVLGIFLHRPREEEYQQIIDGMSVRE